MTPFWNFRKPRKVPLYTRAKLVLTKEQIEEYSIEKINEILKEEFIYDDYKYQKENNILIKEKYRAEGMHKILYQCPNCKTEHRMNSKGTELFCEECNKRWNLNEDGTLSALNGVTEFNHVPDWFEWQRKEVIKEVENGTYQFSDDVYVYSLPRTNKVMKLGDAKVRHTIDEGFVLEGHYNDKDYRIIRSPLNANSLHVEYDYVHIKPYDCFVINTEDDCYFCYPKKQNVIKKEQVQPVATPKQEPKISTEQKIEVPPTDTTLTNTFDLIYHYASAQLPYLYILKNKVPN